ncbi:hypothetical protein SDC9_125047 [bioreactor metagenome]|uniref:Uncharacterized protein n=1 Tax=bioreactor metagenome TaxID=1076179 RepID=A0A645CMA7_9ZZZZ
MRVRYNILDGLIADACRPARAGVGDSLAGVRIRSGAVDKYYAVLGICRVYT